MSVEAEVTEGLQAPVDQNAQATEDAKKLLAELEADGVTAADKNTERDANGNSNGDVDDKSEEKGSDDADEAHAPSEKKTNGGSERERQRERRYSGDRRDRGGQRPARGNRGGRGGSSFSRRDNIKSVLTDQEKSSDPAAIRKQVEFYFSDSNLPMDKFLLEKVGGNKNNPVELSIIHSFKRMRRFEPYEAIVEALKDSEVLQLTDDNTKVQRKVPLPDNIQERVDFEALQVYEDKAMPRSVYVKGFGDEKPSTQFDIEAFFAEHGPTNAIRLRRSDDKLFKGSVFVEFETEEYAKKFLELDPQPLFQGRDLQIMSKKEYCDKKVDDIKAGKIKPNSKRYGNDKPSRGGRGGSFREKRSRDDEDGMDWRTRREQDRKNGFRDDKRRGNRDRRSDRSDSKHDDRENEAEKDERGIPKVKASTSNEDREAQKQEALTKAKAVVEAESKKRDREEEGPGESVTQEPPAKKLDAKAD